MGATEWGKSWSLFTPHHLPKDLRPFQLQAVCIRVIHNNTSLGLWWSMRELAVITKWYRTVVTISKHFSSASTAEHFGDFSFTLPTEGEVGDVQPMFTREGVCDLPQDTQMSSRRKDRALPDPVEFYSFSLLWALPPSCRRDGAPCTQGPPEAAQRCPAQIGALSFWELLFPISHLPP